MKKLTLSEIFSKQPGDRVLIYEEISCWPIMCCKQFESCTFECIEKKGDAIFFKRKLDSEISYPPEMKILNGAYDEMCCFKKSEMKNISDTTTDFNSIHNTKVWFTEVD